jgi:hypothetical protein
MKEYNVGGIFRMQNQKCTQNFGKKTRTENIDWKIILKWILKKEEWDSIDWFHVAQK